MTLIDFVHEFKSRKGHRSRGDPEDIEISLIDFVMRADGFEQNRFSSFVIHKLEDDSKIVTSGAGPRAREFPFELVRSELWVRGILS